MKHGRVCIIPARSGSRRIPNKNIKPFDGKPMLRRAIETAQASEMFERIVVSTDNKWYGQLAESWGAEVDWRQAGLERDEVGTQEVTRGVLAGLTVNSRAWVCCLYTTTPLVLPEDIRAGWEELAKNRGDSKDFCMAVGTEPLRDAGQWYWGRAESFYLRKPLLSTRTIIHPIPEARVCDINTEEDFQCALTKYRALKSSGQAQKATPTTSGRP